jgi:TPR repeat protein
MSARSWAPAHGERSRPYARIAFASGKKYEQQGDLEGAARWFRQAAEADLSDAALRLGDVLGRLADQRGADTDAGAAATVSAAPVSATSGRARHQDRLMAEATRWLSEAHGSKHPDAIELITDMLNRQQRLAAQRAVEPAMESAAP